MLSENVLSDNIKSLMKERGFTQFQLSLAAQVPQPRICDLVKGKVKNPRLETAVKLARALGVTVEDLVSEKNVANG